MKSETRKDRKNKTMAGRRTSDFEFRQQASLSQRVGDQIPDIQELAGSDPKTSQKIQRIKTLGRHGIIDLEEPKWKLILDLLNGDRLALFATSDKTNEISKMGFMLPAKERVYSGRKRD